MLYLREVRRSCVQFWAHYMRRMKLNRYCPVQTVKCLVSSKFVAWLRADSWEFLTLHLEGRLQIIKSLCWSKYTPLVCSRKLISFLHNPASGSYPEPPEATPHPRIVFIQVQIVLSSTRLLAFLISLVSAHFPAKYSLRVFHTPTPLPLYATYFN